MTGFTEFLHPSHHHAVTLGPAAEPFSCDACRELGFGPRYACRQCDFHLHEDCALLGPDPPAESHPFLRGCRLHFRARSRNKVCDACGEDVRGTSYQCAHAVPHDLHPLCLRLEPSVTVDGVTLRLVRRAKEPCARCGRKVAANGISGWSYEADCGGFVCHVACMKLLVLEKYKEGYFGGVSGSSGPSLQVEAHGNGGMVVRGRGGGWELGRRAKKVFKIARMVFKIVVSVIFGNPVGVMAALLEALV